MTIAGRRSLFGCVVAGLTGGALLMPAGAGADQLIQIPTADRVSAPTGEYKRRADGKGEGYGTVFVPAGLSYELMLRYYDDLDGEHRIEGGGQLQVLPDGFVTPGIAIGMWDVTNSSPWGRRAFFVLTKSLTQGQFGMVPKPLERVQLTFGTGTGRLSGIFAGARFDLPHRLSLVAEYDTRRLNAGVWFSPIRPVTLKAELQNGNPFLGGELRARF